MKKLSKLVLREHISPGDIISKKAQKFIVGGYDDYCNGMPYYHSCCDGNRLICCSSNNASVCCNKAGCP